MRNTMSSSQKARDPSDDVMFERARPLLGTIVAIRVVDDAGEHAPRHLQAAIERAFARIERIHAAMSFHTADSELSRINRDAATAPVQASEPLWRVLRASLALARASDGCFDPTIAARLVEHGQLPRPDSPAADLRATWRDIEILPGRHVVFHRPLWLDFGGIAKGYAVDQAVYALRAMGIRSGAVNAGGDLRIFGALSETIHVRDPATPALTRPLLRLRDGAVATSAGYFSLRDGRTALIDPRNGNSLAHRISVTVSAPRSIWADALTKVVLVDQHRASAMLRKLRAQAAMFDPERGLRLV
jgi:FAD:protein FMN transferase